MGGEGDPFRAHRTRPKGQQLGATAGKAPPPQVTVHFPPNSWTNLGKSHPGDEWLAGEGQGPGPANGGISQFTELQKKLATSSSEPITGFPLSEMLGL